MHWLPLACLLEFVFGQLFKYAQRRGHYMPVVVSANYVVLGVTLVLYFLLSGQLHLTVDMVMVGAVTGAVFISSMSIMTKALQFANVAAILMAFRMSIIVPVMLGAWLWGEPVGAGHVGGVALALAGLALMTRGTTGTHRVRGVAALGIVAAVFLAQGMSLCCLRWVHYAELDEAKAQVIGVVGLTAGGLGSLFVSLKRHRPRQAELLTGAGIGLWNVVGLLVILTALSQLHGSMYFPIVTCGVVILDTLVAHYVWKERLRRVAWGGAALAVTAILLVILAGDGPPGG